MWLLADQIAAVKHQELMRSVETKQLYATMAAGATPPVAPLGIRAGMATGRRAVGQTLVRAGELIAGAPLLELEQA